MVELAKTFEALIQSDSLFELFVPRAWGLVCFRLKVGHVSQLQSTFQFTRSFRTKLQEILTIIICYLLLFLFLVGLDK